LPEEKTNPNSAPASNSFEQALEQLEQVVASLEEGRCGLSESLGHYERGINLLRECYDLLSQAERKIEVLSGFDAQGAPITAPFEEQGRPEDQPGRRASPRATTPRRNNPRAEAASDDIPF
jgi:exodeoxyribonuclease VII small subunit